MSSVSTTCSLLPKAVLLFPSRVRVYTAFVGVSFFVVFGFCRKYFWGCLGGSIGVWAQFIFYGFQTWVSLVFLSPRFGVWGGGEKAKPQLAEFGMTFSCQ